MKVKIFKCEMVESLEAVINDWLRDRDVTIINMNMSIYVNDDGDEGGYAILLYGDKVDDFGYADNTPSCGEKRAVPKMPGKGVLLCDECQSTMVKRTRHSDGTPFWGCSKFPACKGLKSYAAGLAQLMDINKQLGLLPSHLEQEDVLDEDEDTIDY